MKKRLFSFLMAIAFLLPTVTSSVYASSNQVFLSQNEEMTQKYTLNEVMPIDSNNSISSISMDTVDISAETTSLNITITTEDSSSAEIQMEGYFSEQVVTNEEIGLVGIFEGTYNQTLLTMDITRAPSGEIFVVLSFGYAGETTSDPVIFGEYTTAIRDTIKAYIKDQFTINEDEEVDSSNQVDPALSGSTRLVEGDILCLNTNVLTSAGYEVGSISLYGPRELRNQGIGEYYAKINTNSDGIVDYLKNERDSLSSSTY